MVAPVYGSPGGRLARALTRALALALVLALLVGLFLSGLTGAIPISGRQWGPNGPVPPESRSRSVLLDAETGQLRLVDGRHPDAVAWANLTNAIRKTGWAFLELQTNGRYNDSLQAYAAGVVEAAVSEELIYMHWMNTVVNYCGPFEYEVGYCEKLKSFLETNLEWMQEEMELNQGSAYWHQVRLTLLQLKGLEDSYEGSMTFPTGRFTVKPLGFLLLQLTGDLGDLEPALNKTKTKHVMGSGSCSALIKLLPGQTDLLIAHNTWTSYQNMLRVIKKYRFQFREDPQENSPLAPGNKLVFSSYPGTLFSCDDFYIMGSGLVTLETTIGNRNPALWKYVHPKDCVLEWLRNVVANRLALDGDAWADTFKRFNSGTGMVVVADKTLELYQKTYWASYNIPYFESVFNASGLQALVAQYGDWFSYDGSPRAQIFRRNQSLVHDLDSMLRLMRYNDFLHDPLSLCKACNPQANAENAISARSDLNPANGSYPFQALHQRSHGGIDVKVTSMALARAFRIIAVSGPTWDQLPPFQWSSSPFSGLLHMGQPDLWKFSPIEVWWD
ncbi:PREDICTED: putative phospholipase B-like 2 isoform X2 [Odobenus rosmarus divergens]|uniref:Phospholipase B-like n=1 Tax=Odobenus rosmarus divergens TaxID=9708 RepID=A0A2U3WN12_ODORO|nr:PREDICTED: putative phospholipase B-like 2 isoform X2 [Odobenus rosmarus divergens]